MATRDAQRGAERSPGDRAARPPQRSATWLALVAVLAVGLAVGFAGGRSFSTSGGAAAPIPSQDPSEASAADLPARMLALDPFIVNLLGEDATRYLKVRVELEAESPEVRTELEARLPQLRDNVITVLGTRDLAQVTSFEGRALLKRDLEDRLNGLLESGRVRSVLFTEFVVQ